MLEHPEITRCLRTGYPHPNNDCLMDTFQMVMEGILCTECGEHIDGDEPGYPRKCKECEENDI